MSLLVLLLLSTLAAVARAHVVPQAGNASCACVDYGRSCVVAANSGLTVCWGVGLWGQLGYGSTADFWSPAAALAAHPGGVQLSEFNNVSVQTLACGYEFSLALLADGSAVGFGRNQYGQLGLGHTLSVGDDELPWQGGPATLGGPARDLACGATHCCAVMRDAPNVGRAACWGYAFFGQLGYANQNMIGNDETVASVGFVDVGGSGNVSAVFCGGWHTLALMSDGALRAWGRNEYGQLGLAHFVNIGDDEVPASQPDIGLGALGIDAVTGGGYHSCVVSTGRAKCWGRGDRGQAGTGTATNVDDPSAVGFIDFGSAGAYVVQVEAHFTHTCALLLSGDAVCFGEAGSGRLGCGWPCPNALAPNGSVALSGPATRLAVGSIPRHTLAVHPNGSFQAWGLNAWGQLGYGDNETVGDDETPASVGDVSFPAGVRCAEPLFGTLTATVASATRPRGHLVPWLDNASCLCAGFQHSCLISALGETVCFGRATHGQLGYSSTSTVMSPSAALAANPGGVQVTQTGSVGVTKLVCGYLETLALLENGEARGWGWNSRGQLGLGHTENVGDDELPWEAPGGPVTLSGPARDVCAGRDFACAVLDLPDFGEVACWGDGGHGRLGYGNTVSIGDNETVASAGFVDVGGTGTVVAIFCGGRHVLALMSDRALRAWGWNQNGQLGLGHTDWIGDDELPSSQLNIALGLSGGTLDAVSAGFFHSCVLAQGDGKCWGRGVEGQIGTGSPNDVLDPSAIGFIDFGVGAYVVQLGTFFYHTCAVLLEGSVTCFGDSADGKLGCGWNCSDRLSPNDTVALSGPVTRLALGPHADHTLAVHPDGSFQAWGSGTYGKLGYGNVDNVGDDETPASVGDVSFPDGVRCAEPLFGTLTAPTATATATATQPHGHLVPWARNASCACMGIEHSCVVSRLGESVCWGSGVGGRLGYGSTTSYWSPSAALAANPGGVQLTVNNTFAVRKLACGWHFSIALLANGDAVGFGVNGWGQLGRGHIQSVGDDELPWQGPSGGTVTLSGAALDVSCGRGHCCAVMDTPNLWKVACWGHGGNGRLGYANTAWIGDTETVSSAGFVDVGGTGAVVAVFCGGSHTLAMLNDGALRAWGYNNVGQLGLGHTSDIGDDEAPSSQLSVALGLAGDPIDAFSAGDFHNCVGSLGRAKCWGWGQYGQIGTGNTSDVADPSSIGFIDFGLGAYVVQIEGFREHTCGVLITGDVVCFGFAGNGRLGCGWACPQRNAPSVPVALSGPVTRLAVGCHSPFTLAVHPNSSFQAWGYNNAGQLGYGDTNTVGDDETPASVGDVSFTAGVRCAEPLFGTLTATVTAPTQPVHSVPRSGNASCICGGLGHSCLVSGVGDTVCWGIGLFGRLGYGSTTNYFSPSSALAANAGGVQVTQTGNVAVSKLVCGWEIVMALLADGLVQGWGHNDFGQLGLGHTVDVGDDERPWAAGPVTLSGPTLDICVGMQHACAVLDAPNLGKASCWGAGSSGALGYANVNHVGDDETVASVGFVDVGGSRVAVAAFCGGLHTLVLMNDGALRAWGANVNGQLGLGHTNNIGDDELPSTQSDIALGLLAGESVNAVSAGELHSCVLSLGRAKCWGAGSAGRLGTGNTADWSDPSALRWLDFGPGAYVVQIEAFYSHTCGVLIAGTVKCFGDSSSGHLGCGFGCTDRLAPNETVALSGPVTRLAGGAYAEHTLAVHPGGSFQAWGRGIWGQLGYGDTSVVGDDETPASVGDVSFPDGVRCAEPLFGTLSATHVSVTEPSDTGTQPSNTATVTMGSVTATQPSVTATQPTATDSDTEPAICATPGTSALDLPAYRGSPNCRSSFTDGFWLRAPVDHWLVGLRVPDVSGVQNVQVVFLDTAPLSLTNGTTVFYATDVPNGEVIDCNIHVPAQTWVGVLGACGTTSVCNSPALESAYNTSIGGTATEMRQLAAPSNIHSGPATQFFMTSGGISRVEYVCACAAPTTGASATHSATELTHSATTPSATVTVPSITATELSATATAPSVSATLPTITATQVTETVTQPSLSVTQATLTATLPSATATVASIVPSITQPTPSSLASATDTVASATSATLVSMTAATPMLTTAPHSVTDPVVSEGMVKTAELLLAA